MNIEDELRDHIERETLENIEAGMAPAAARAAAHRKFGNMLRVAEETRSVWVWQWLERLWQDLAHAARLFSKSPAFVAIAVFSIALGTGANVAIFSAADALVLRPLAVANPDELVTIGNQERNGVFRWLSASYPDYADIRAWTRTFQGIAAYENERVGVSIQRNVAPEIRFAAIVSGNFFDVMGVVPVAGRGFHAEEDQVAGRDAVTVISYTMWQQEFGAAPDVVGRKLWVNGSEFTVVGVTPESFTGTAPTRIRQALYIPLAMWPRLLNSRAINPLEDRSLRYLTLKGRLRAGVTMRAAQAELDTIGANLERTYPATNRNQPIFVESEFQYNVERHPLDAGAVAVLSLLSMAVLGVACANVAGLLTSRAPVRAREIALRLAIGASRARLVRQLITESLAIAVLGGIAGLGVGSLGIHFLRQLRFPSDILTMPAFAMDRRALLFSLAIAMVSAFVFGVSPALQATRVNLSRALKNSDTSTERRVRLTGRNALVTVQVALSLIIVTLSVYVFQIFEQDVMQEPGFRVTKMAKVNVAPSQAGYTSTKEIEYFEKVLDAARRLPQAVHVSATSTMPLFHIVFSPLVPEGSPLPAGTEVVKPDTGAVAEDYFATMEIPLLAGRDFRVADNQTAPLVAIVNEAFARHYWPGESAVGKRLRKGRRDGPQVEIVGVAKNSKYLFVAEPPQEFVYFPFRQDPRGEMTLLVQTSGASVSAVAPLKAAVATIDRSVPLHDADTIEAFFDAIARSLGRITLTLVAAMCAIGIGLTMIGLYALVSYAVSRRTREIGIRMAVGAAKTQISGMMFRQGMVPVWIGIVLGSTLSAATLRVLPSIVLLGRPYDARSYFLLLPALILTTGLAAFIPSSRASKVDPAVALRAE
jgi:putative ABC transport system permease protein